ncbi:MAG: hypothetical protein LBO09_05440 [Candidatus Peribacteria bacterium]|jgi:hypothetical protein|nr:hypothetical protein [Candidatus Peribacteria bacterium]
MKKIKEEEEERLAMIERDCWSLEIDYAVSMATLLLMRKSFLSCMEMQEKSMGRCFKNLLN